MDKIALNNEIVLMRHAVRKARVAVVSKLIKEIKLLEARKYGNENVIEKSKRKANKLIEEMKMLKKLKDDDISRFAIINTRNLQEVLSDPSANIKTRIKVRLAFHKTLKAKVENFRTKFPDYQAYFDSENRTKVKKKRPNKFEETTKNDEADVKQPEEPEKEISDALLIATSNVESKEQHYCDASSVNEDDIVSQSEMNESLTSEMTTAENIIKKKTKKLRTEKTELAVVGLESKKCPTVKVVSKLATVKRFNVTDNVMENIGMEESIVDDVDINEDTVQDDDEIDPFLTRTNENNKYSRLLIPPSKSFINNNQYNDGYDSRKNSFVNIQGKGKPNNKFERNRGNTGGKFIRSSTNKPLDNRMKNNSIGHNKMQQINTTSNATTEDLHPSWAARKKQQDILKQGFQGKKIVFDDD